MSSIVIGLVVGYVVAYFMGMIDFSSVQSYSGVNIPIPFKYGLAFSWSSFIAVGLIYMITAIEAYGDILFWQGYLTLSRIPCLPRITG